MRDGAPIPDDVLRDTPRPKMPNLPVDVIENKNPPKFRWRQIIETPVGKKTVVHEGLLPPSMEQAVFAVVGIAKQLTSEVEKLTVENALLKKRVESLSAALTKEPKAVQGDGRINKAAEAVLAAQAK